MDSANLALALAGLALGPLRYYQSAGSTNDEMAGWADHGAPDLALIVADEQTAGRGRRGRRWFTTAQAGLAFSLLLKDLPDIGRAPASTAVQAGAFPTARLSGMGALAVAQALEDAYGLDAKIKWPNDVLLSAPQAQGAAKVSGILVEARWLGSQLSAVILGIGVNIRSEAIPDESDWLFPATAVETVLKRPVERPALLRAILVRLLHWRARFSSADLLAAWQSRLAYREEWVQVFTDRGATALPACRGKLLGLDETGRLELLDERGEIFRLDSGEIRLRPTAAP